MRHVSACLYQKHRQKPEAGYLQGVGGNGVAGIWKIVTFSVFFYIVLICGVAVVLYLFKKTK